MSSSPMESLVGVRLLTKVGAPQKATKDLMKGKDLVLFYFSASWCPPCKSFSPILAEFYKACAKDGKLEIVYISSDKTVPEFEEYYKKMPWLSVPTEAGCADIKNNLSQLLGIQGIPSLVVVDAKTGEFIGANAREEVTKVGADVGKGKALISEWMATERKPMSEVSNAMGGEQPFIMKIFLWFAKNPMAVFAFMYGYKYLKKQWNEMYGIEEGADEAEDIPDMPQGGDDSEF